ncbi:MAG: cache domain-containing protein, partial [Desulfoferrobacter sp.]
GISIQSRLILLLLCILLPILVIQGFLHHQMFQHRRAQELETNMEVARAVGRAFVAFVKDVLHTELAIGIAATSYPSLFSNSLQRLLEASAKSNPSVRNFNWLSLDGRVLASSNPNVVGVDVSDRPYIVKIASGAEWVVGDLFISKVTKDPVFAICRGIRSDEGKLLGIVLAAISPDGLDNVLAFERPNQGAIALMDSKGRLVYRFPHLNPSWGDRDWFRQYAAVREAVGGKEVSDMTVVAYDGKKRLYSDTPISSIGWVAGAGRREEEVTGPILADMTKGIFLFLLVSIAAFLIALFDSRKITKHVLSLRSHAMALGRGKYVEPLLIGHVSEFQELEEAFNKMAEEVGLREQALRNSQERFRLLSQTAGQLLASPEPQSIVSDLCRQVMEHLECDVFFNFLADEQTGKLHLNTCTGIPEDEVRRIEWLDYGDAICGCVVSGGERIIAEDILNAPDPRTELVKGYGIQAWACHPLLAQGRVIGTLSFGAKNRAHFAPDNLDLMKTVADQVAIAMERIKLIKELQRSQDELELRIQERTMELSSANEELRQVPSRLISAQEEERKRLAAELHDSIGQTLAALKFGVETVLSRRNQGDMEEAMVVLEQFVPTLQRSIDETRSIYMGLRPKILEEMGLLATLDWFIREFRKLYPNPHIEPELNLDEADIPEDLKIVLFRIVQEALSNIAKHSKAEWVDLSLLRNGKSIELTISDDGVGMDLDYILQTSTAKSLGLTGMKERAELTGGSFLIESIPGEGTAVRVIWAN